MRLGPQALERSLVIGTKNPPRRFALSAELSDQDCATSLITIEGEAGDGPSGSRQLGWLFDIYPAGLREMKNDPLAVVEGEHEVLGSARHGRQHVTKKLGGFGRNCLKR